MSPSGGDIVLVLGLVSTLVMLPPRKAISDRLNRPVSVEIEAAPASRLLPQLGKACGLSLTADASTKNDVLIISVKNVTPRALMARIANVDAAEWRKIGPDKFQLYRSTAQKTKQEQLDFKGAVEQVRKAQATYAKTLPSNGIMTAEKYSKLLHDYNKLYDQYQITPTSPGTRRAEFERRRQAIIDFLPQSRLVQQIAIHLDPKFIARMPWQQMVFTDHPYPLQIQLPLNLDPFYDELVQNQKLLAKAADTMRNTNAWNYPVYNELENNQFHSRPLKTLLNIYRTRHSLSFSIWLVKDDQIAIQGPSVSIRLREDRVPMPSRFSRSLLDCLPPNAQRFYRNMTQRKPADIVSGWEPMDRDVKAMVIDPFKIEPQSLFSGATLLAMAHDTGKNLVASLSDDDMSLAGAIRRGLTITVGQAEQRLRQSVDLRVDETSNWLEACPKMKSDIWLKHIDRALVRQTALAIDTASPNVFELARLSRKLPDSFSTSILSGISYLSPQALKQFSDLRSNYHRLRFIALLNKQQLETILVGGKLTYRSLSPDQKQALKVAIQQHGFIFLPIQPSQDGKLYPGQATYNSTEMLSNGISDTAYFQSASWKSDGIRIVYKEGATNLMTAEDVAWAFFKSEHQDVYGEQFTKPEVFELIPMKNVTLEFFANSNLKGTLEVRGMEFGSSLQNMKYSDLPSSFRSAIERHLDLLRKNIKPRKEGGSPIGSSAR